ncbi:MAG TPA: histidine kinase N-terminal domain-containing protein [Acidimicrobiales bacterium]|nr:histidine kinase N-terminal domain-containing protein [Acidimicrobiales bacterium]
MATLAELAAAQTSLDEPTIDHLLRLIASWSLLADLSFSDMLLMAKVTEDGHDDEHLIVLGQMRPNNRTTLIVDDLVGSVHRVDEWLLARDAWRRGTRIVGELAVAPLKELVPVWCVPVSFRGEVVAVMVRLQGHLRGSASLYEQQYLSVFERLCDMVSDATFPYREDVVAGPGLPRVGDGVILIDETGRVEFATPNAFNALHRLGIYTSAEGRSFAEVGLRARAIERSLEFGIPAIEEIDRDHDVAILFHGIPLIAQGDVTGVLTLVRDVSDIRQLNRMVLNKEAAVREVHHRVKNNLQTISSLLSLQARRSEQDETRIALREAERRVRSIAVVHEVLSREPGEEVVFDEIVRSLVELVEDTNLASHPVEIVVNGELGVLSTDLATPLAVALAELLTNAVEHAFSDIDDSHDEFVGVVTLNLLQEDAHAIAEIRDNGRGLGEDFSLEVPTSLGLSIVRDLIRAQLYGEIEMKSLAPEEGGGTYVRVSVPLSARL